MPEHDVEDIPVDIPFITVRTPDPQVHVRRTLAADATLSFKARGIMLLVLTRNAGVSSVDTIAAASEEDGRHATQSGLQELEAAGYARMIRLRRMDGTMAGRRWMFFEHPDADPFDGEKEEPVITEGELELFGEEMAKSPETQGTHRQTGFPTVGKPVRRLARRARESLNSSLELGSKVISEGLRPSGGAGAPPREDSGFSFGEGAPTDYSQMPEERLFRAIDEVEAGNERNKLVTRIFNAHFGCRGDWSHHGRLAKYCNERSHRDVVEQIRRIHRSEDLGFDPTEEPPERQEHIPSDALDYLAGWIRGEEDRHQPTIKLRDLSNE